MTTRPVQRSVATPAVAGRYRRLLPGRGPSPGPPSPLAVVAAACAAVAVLSGVVGFAASRAMVDETRAT